MIVAALAFMASCTGGAKEEALIITDQGVGSFTFEAEASQIDLGKGFEARDEKIEDMGDFYPVISIYKDGELVARKDGSLFFYSADFKTEDGIHAGMTLAELVEIKGGDVEIHPYDRGSLPFGIKLGGRIEAYFRSGLKDPSLFDRWYRDPSFDVEFSLDKFELDTKIDEIVVHYL